MVQDLLKNVRAEARQVSDERKAKAKRRYDAKVVFRKQFEVGEEVLLLDPTPTSKFGDKWEGPYTILSVNEKSGTYYLTGRNSLRLKHAVNGDRLKLFTREVKSMVPDVMVSKANEQFQRWVNSRLNACVKVVEDYADF
jgi:DNA-directed RNA polymerase specialized sigma54-like protein